MDEPSTERVKYEAKGTAQAAQYIIKTRGLRGLYSGFHLHFGRLPTSLKISLVLTNN